MVAVTGGQKNYSTVIIHQDETVRATVIITAPVLVLIFLHQVQTVGKKHRQCCPWCNGVCNFALICQENF